MTQVDGTKRTAQAAAGPVDDSALVAMVAAGTGAVSMAQAALEAVKSETAVRGARDRVARIAVSAQKQLDAAVAELATWQAKRKAARAEELAAFVSETSFRERITPELVQLLGARDEIARIESRIGEKLAATNGAADELARLRGGTPPRRDAADVRAFAQVMVWRAEQTRPAGSIGPLTLHEWVQSVPPS
jgi:hypothetical protein